MRLLSACSRMSHSEIYGHVFERLIVNVLDLLPDVSQWITSILLSKYYWVDQINKSEVGATYGTYGGG
jgi:hypothetical protein